MELLYAHIKQVALHMARITIVIFFLYEKGALQRKFWPSPLAFLFNIFVGKFNLYETSFLFNDLFIAF